MSPERNPEESDRTLFIFLLIKAGRFEAALPLAEEEFMREPNLSTQRHYLLILNKLGRHEEVEALYSSFDGLSRKLNMRIACESLLELKKYQDVIQLLQGRISGQVFADPELYSLLTEAYARTGNHEQVVRTRIQAAERLAESEEALADTFRDLVEDQPDDPERHVLLGHSLVELGDYCGAINEFTEAIKLVPHYDFPDLDYDADGIVEEREKILEDCETKIAECKTKLQDHS